MLANVPAHAYRGQRTYCGHCKPCVANLDIAMINKFYDLATMQPKCPLLCRVTTNCWKRPPRPASTAMPARAAAPLA